MMKLRQNSFLFSALCAVMYSSSSDARTLAPYEEASSRTACRASKHCAEESPRRIDSSGLVGAYGHQGNQKYYLLTQNSLFILKEKPADEIIGKMIQFKAELEKISGKLDLSSWREVSAPPFILQLKGRVIHPSRTKRWQAYFKIDDASGKESVNFYFCFLDAAQTRIKAKQVCIIHAQARVISHKNMGKDSDINEIKQMNEIDTNSIHLFNVY